MKNSFFKALLKGLMTPSPKTIANQLRRPNGFLAKRVGEKMNESNRSLYDLTINSLNLIGNERILEIGFGNGYHYQDMFNKYNSIQISGIDFSDAMLSEAKKRNRLFLHSGRLTLQKASSDAIPFEDAIFDKVFCVNVNYFWEYPEEHLNEIKRVLKPGGEFLTSMRPEETLKKLAFASHGFILYSEDEWIDRLEDIGFRLIKTSWIDDNPIQLMEEMFAMKGICIRSEKPLAE